MSFTLATLKSTVQDYLQVNETTFNANLDEFIRESEDRIFSMVCWVCLGQVSASTIAR